MNESHADLSLSQLDFEDQINSFEGNSSRQTIISLP